MSHFIQAKPEIFTNFGRLQLRQNLINHSVTIGIKNFSDWDEGTEQVKISKSVIHFIQPNGELVGLKVLEEVSS